MGCADSYVRKGCTEAISENRWNDQRNSNEKVLYIYNFSFLPRCMYTTHKKKEKENGTIIDYFFPIVMWHAIPKPRTTTWTKARGLGITQKWEMGKQEADLKKKLPIRRRLCNSITLLNIEFIFFAILCFFNVVVGLCRFQCTNTV